MHEGNLRKLRSLIVEEYLDSWEKNDPAHRLSHFDEVYRTALEIDHRLKINLPKKQMMVVSYYHDLFANVREVHHHLSYNFILGEKCHILRAWLRKEEIGLVANACREHRASYKGKFSSILSELMNSADRERPKGVARLLERSLHYSIAKNPDLSKEEICKLSSDHIKEKYGRGGYARFPDLYVKAFKEELEEQYDRIETADLYKIAIGIYEGMNL